jgi:phage gp16-like protein
MAMKYYDEVKRRRELAKLHVAKKQLGIDDEAWRMICLRVTDGKCDSSAAMTAAMRQALLEELRAKGFAAQPGTGAATRKFRGAQDATARKIRACWLDLKNAGALSDASEAALMKFVEHRTGKQALQFLTVDEAIAVIEALKQWHRRVTRNVRAARMGGDDGTVSGD